MITQTEEYVLNDEMVVMVETEIEVIVAHGIQIDDNDETVQMVDVLLWFTEILLKLEQLMFHDDLVEHDDAHMHVIAEKQAEVMEQHEVIKYVNLLIKTKKTWQMHDA